MFGGAIRNSDGAPFSCAEWGAFVAGMEAGEFDVDAGQPDQDPEA